MESLSSSTELLDINTLTPLHRGQKEWRFLCPVCPEKRGKSDTEGKLYWNVLKNVGYCFKCSTSFFPEGAEGFDKNEIEWKKCLDALVHSYPNSIFESLEFPQEVHFDFPELDRDLLLYLKKRNPFLLQLKDWLGLRAWRGRDTGICIPFLYNGKICKFQARFVTKKGLLLDKNDKMKYYTSPGPKCLYSPFHIFGDFQTVGGIGHLTIAEGVFDSIALAILGFPNPVAILGDRLTPLHLWDIRHLNPPITQISLCLDDVERNNAIEKVVRKFLPCLEEVQKFSFWLPNFKDAEEWLVGNLTNEALRKECTKMVLEWVNASKENTW